MKKLFSLLFITIITCNIHAVSYGPDCYVCFLDSSYHISKIYDSHYCYANYNDKKLLLSGLIDNGFWGNKDKRFQNKEYKISLVNRSPGILHSKNKEFVRRPMSGMGNYKDDYPLLKFESQDGTIFYHVYGYGDMPVYKTPDCECYWNSRIIQKEDKFNKISAYYFMETYMKYRYDALTILKADSTYAISLSLSDSYKCGSIEGMYLLFDDDEVIKDVNIICEYKYSDGLYKLSATMILSKEQFMRFTKHQIKSVKLGSIESDITPNKAYKILRLSQTLLNK